MIGRAISNSEAHDLRKLVQNQIDSNNVNTSLLAIGILLIENKLEQLVQAVHGIGDSIQERR